MSRAMILKRLCYNMDMDKGINHKGFTLIELSLSLVFISTLSLAVVMVIAGAISSYHKSITLNQVNSVGTNIVDDMRLSVQQSSSNRLENMCEWVYGVANDTCFADKANRFVTVTREAPVKVKSSGRELGAHMPVFGAFCTGVYSFIWNSGYYYNDEYIVGSGAGVSPASLKYNDTSIDGFKLLKVKDENRAVCVAATRVRNGVITNEYKTDEIPSLFDISMDGLFGDNEKIVIDEEPVELLSGDEDGLALYDLTVDVSEQAGVSKNIFYYSSFILGTVQGGLNVNASGGFCAVPDGYSDLNENFDYCAINKFNFAALANGG